MTIRDGDIPTIFNPTSNTGIGARGGRTPSVVITAEGGELAITSNGAGSNAATPPPSAGHAHTHHPPFTHADSVSSHCHETGSLTGVISGTAGGVLVVSGGHGSPTGAGGASCVPSGKRGCMARLKGCGEGLCSTSARKIYFGIWVTVCMTASWVGATHSIKYLYLDQSDYHSELQPANLPQSTADLNITALQPIHGPSFQAPFCTTWFMTNWTMLFFPLYFIARLTTTRCSSPIEVLVESIRDFRDKGFTAGRFLTRCSLFCILWVGTNYMYIRSLRILLATDVMALFATNVSCVYLLSWVILHEQFVGIRIMAVIMCDTGVALLAYMDGITGSPTLGGVVLAASAAAGSGVYKVLFKKVIGDATYGQVALFFSIIGMLNAALLWPLCLTLLLTGIETLHWERLPWPALLSASALYLVANLLGNFSVAFTYDLFITLGLITAVPVSAALDVVLYGAQFEGMKLAGMILISVGFFLVMFPDNWPDYITRLLRNIIMLSHSARPPFCQRHANQATQQQQQQALLPREQTPVTTLPTPTTAVITPATSTSINQRRISMSLYRR